MTKWTVSGSELWQWYRGAIVTARELQIEPEEVDWLIQATSNIRRLELRLANFPASIQLDRPWDGIVNIWQQRCTDRQPIQYLVGSTAWRQFELKVTPAVLIPRPETELIIDFVLEHSEPDQRNGHWVDLGTGSGAIAIGLATELPQAHLHAVDISPAALEVARDNIQNQGLSDRITLYEGAWWQPLTHLRGQVTGLVSNPPYIPSQTVTELQPEVVNWEPHLALDGGADGLTAIRILVDEAPQFIRTGGLWAIEMMTDQGSAIVELLERHGSYGSIKVIQDWTGRDRFVFARVLT